MYTFVHIHIHNKHEHSLSNMIRCTLKEEQGVIRAHRWHLSCFVKYVKVVLHPHTPLLLRPAYFNTDSEWRDAPFQATYLERGFPLKSAISKALQNLMLSGISGMSAGEERRRGGGEKSQRYSQKDWGFTFYRTNHFRFPRNHNQMAKSMEMRERKGKVRKRGRDGSCAGERGQDIVKENAVCSSHACFPQYPKFSVQSHIYCSYTCSVKCF